MPIKYAKEYSYKRGRDKKAIKPSDLRVRTAKLPRRKNLSAKDELPQTKEKEVMDVMAEADPKSKKNAKSHDKKVKPVKKGKAKPLIVAHSSPESQA